MQYWENISTREQRTLKWGLITVTVLIVVRFMWWPLFSYVERAQDDIATEIDLIEWMKPAVASLKDKKGILKTIEQNAPPLSTIEKSFAQAGLSSFVKSLSQNAGGNIVLQADNIPFGSLAQCLELLSQHYGIVPESLTAIRQTTGIVNVEIIF